MVQVLLFNVQLVALSSQCLYIVLLSQGTRARSVASRVHVVMLSNMTPEPTKHFGTEVLRICSCEA